MKDQRRDYLMLSGLAMMAARFLAYFRSRRSRHWRGLGMTTRAHEGVMLCLAVAVHNLEQAAAWLSDTPKRRINENQPR